MSDNRFAAIPTAALEDERITATDIAVLAALARYADKHGWCYPKQDDLARLARMRRETVNRRINVLCKLGYVEKTGRTLPGKGKIGNQYRVVLDVKRAEPDQFYPETNVILDHNGQCDPRSQRNNDGHCDSRCDPGSQRGRCDPPVTPDVIPQSHPYIKHPKITPSSSLRSDDSAPTLQAKIVPLKAKPESVKREPQTKFAMSHGWQPSHSSRELATGELNMSDGELRCAHANFIDYWAGQANCKKGRKSADGWNRAFDTNLRTLANWWGTSKRQPARRGRQDAGGVVAVARAEIQRGSASGDWI